MALIILVTVEHLCRVNSGVYSFFCRPTGVMGKVWVGATLIVNEIVIWNNVMCQWKKNVIRCDIHYGIGKI